MKTPARLIVQAAFIAALASCSLFDYTSMAPKKYAMVYGVTNYVSTFDGHWTSLNNPNLEFPDADARSVASMLSGAGYSILLRYVDGSGNEYLQRPTDPAPVLQGNVLSDPTGTLGPSTANLSLDIAAYFHGTVGPNDVFLFYFSGHGMQDPAGSLPLRHEYIVPLGGVLWYSSVNGYFGDPNLSVRDDQLGGILSANIQSPRKVVILDTCNSGGFIGNSLEVDATPPAQGATRPSVLTEAIANFAAFQASPTGVSPYNAQVISAAGRDESSYETTRFGHGVMTYYLLQTAGQADLNRDGAVTVLEAFSYVKAGIEAGWNQSDPESAFTPHVSGGPVDFVLF